ncbi:MAG: recombinase family protein [Stellaceae bacterium]
MAGTTTPRGRLMLTVLGSLAEFERELIRARADEGRTRAKARVVRLGRRPKLTPHQKREVLQRRESSKAVTEIVRSYTAIIRRFHGSWDECSVIVLSFLSCLRVRACRRQNRSYLHS